MRTFNRTDRQDYDDIACTQQAWVCAGLARKYVQVSGWPSKNEVVVSTGKRKGTDQCTSNQVPERAVQAAEEQAAR